MTVKKKGQERYRKIIAQFFERASPVVARDLIGCVLCVDGVGGVIVETEAYERTDPASHTYQGRETLRNRTMFGAPAVAYVYRAYGLHWCLNFVTGSHGGGSAVLIRALEPLFGIETMKARRRINDERLLCSGPGRLCQALNIDGTFDGKRLAAPPFELRHADIPGKIVSGPRVGISKARDVPWRFGLAESAFLSVPMATR